MPHHEIQTRRRPGRTRRVRANTAPEQVWCLEQTIPHPDPLPSDGRGNSQTRLVQLPKRLDSPTDGRGFSVSSKTEARPSVAQNPKVYMHGCLVRMALTPRGVLQHSSWDALFIALALAHGLALIGFPSIPLIAIGLWWNANTIAHNFIHRPFFRSRRLKGILTEMESQ